MSRRQRGHLLELTLKSPRCVAELAPPSCSTSAPFNGWLTVQVGAREEVVATRPASAFGDAMKLAVAVVLSLEASERT